MAGFGIFRTYQKASMVALAILAMLAFFVLPPLLQYGGQAASLADTPVATWNGGEVREKGLDRAVMMKFVVNRFLQEAAMAAGRDPAQASRFDVDERSAAGVERHEPLLNQRRKLEAAADLVHDEIALECFDHGGP